MPTSISGHEISVIEKVQEIAMQSAGITIPAALGLGAVAAGMIAAGPALLAIAGVATAAANGVGVVGVWPGHTTQVFAGGATCSGITGAILAAVRRRPAVINMSYGFFVDDLLADCFTHVRATQLAFGAGVTLVPATDADMRGKNANPVESLEVIYDDA